MRSNSGHKLLAMFDGMPLVRRSALIAKASTALSVIVVGHRQDDIREALTGLSLHVIPNPDYRVGISSSLAAGFAAAVAEGADGVLILLADMPGVSANNLDQVEMGTAALTDVDTAEAIVAAGGIPVEDC
ncbi:nucleotidyltransferase family protein [Rhizobium leguminosarum]|uniref:nucleotidyltransferase family protein n=1 Tax=Rhizobium leguminosarum TaxID=384 RepID=UPI001FEE15E4|nr:NTP transferase domain-containing protein [Rhizobium leguminosarum]